MSEILSRYPAEDPVHRAVTRSGPELIAAAERATARLADVRGTAGGLVGHSGTAVTETVYRHQLRPVMEEGATAMNKLFPRRQEG